MTGGSAYASGTSVSPEKTDRRVIVWCLSCGLPHPHRFYICCPFCGSGDRDEREAWMWPPL